MNTAGVLCLSVLGLVGTYLFIVVKSEHHDQEQTRGIHQQIERERFDRDFEQAWNGATFTDPDRAKRLADLEAKQREMKEKAAVNAVDLKKREQELLQALDQLSGSSAKKGQPQ